MHPEKLKNIQNLTPQERYGYLIRKAADFQEVWLIQENGKYVTLGDKEEQITIPVWPEKEFTELMLTDSWKYYGVKSISVHDFIEWLDELEKEGYKIAGFPSASLNSVVVSADEMKNHLIHELQQYE